MLYYQTLYGRYWSSSIVSSTHSYRLDMYSTRLVKADSNNKRLGFPLRCVMALRFFLSTGSLGARSYPLSYVYSGYYFWLTGMLYDQTGGGRYWPSSISNSNYSFDLHIENTRLVKSGGGNKRIGFSLRCAIRLVC